MTEYSPACEISLHSKSGVQTSITEDFLHCISGVEVRNIFYQARCSILKNTTVLASVMASITRVSKKYGQSTRSGQLLIANLQISLTSQSIKKIQDGSLLGWLVLVVVCTQRFGTRTNTSATEVE